MLIACTCVSAKGKVDHSLFKALDREFSSSMDVTKACLGCHKNAAKQIQKTKHWKWEYLNPENKQRLGKKNMINNFCITPQSNFASCTICHIGYGWKGEKFDFTSEERVDCLVCHDTTGGYIKGKAGYPADFVNLKNVAQNVGKTSRDTCGACHFFGGGGDAVKHGDLDSSMAAPDRELDVHMDALGANFTCTTCHKGLDHDVVGSRYGLTVADDGGENTAACRSCHLDNPHPPPHEEMNRHAIKIACETCHIPAFARGGVATMMTWDWSTAGKLTADGKPLVKKDKKGNVVYYGKKGSFTYAENVVPEYIWFNGKVSYTLLGDKINKKDGVVYINRYYGSADDGISRIWPVKVFRGVQPYDPVNHTMVVPHTAGEDDAAYWLSFDWVKSITHGMKIAGRPFSGKVDFVKTQMTWPITHMVAPAEDALSCDECHSKNSRLKHLKGLDIKKLETEQGVNK
jgi:octaheme c-type cytochrome (tetrathionate reductase family)